MPGPLTVSAGGPASFDLTPGAPSAQWDSGTTEPTLLRIRGVILPFVNAGVSVAEGGVRESRFCAAIIYWGQSATAVLDPLDTASLSSDEIMWHGFIALDTRDFVIPAAGTVVNPFTVNIAGPGQNGMVVDVRAKRRVRSERDRLQLAVRMGEYTSQSTPPLAARFVNTGGIIGWSLRFLYRAHR